MPEILVLILTTIVALLPISNPPSSAVLFLSLSREFSEKHQHHQALMAAIYMALILVVFFAAGSFIMSLFGISLPGVRIAGGLIISGVGFGMLKTEPPEQVSKQVKEEAQQMRDISFTPLAMPGLAGPGAISVTLTMATDAKGVTGHSAVIVGILFVAAVAWMVLRTAPVVVKFLGATGVNALTRVMGFLLVCVGVQFVVAGVHGFFLDESFARPAIEMINRLSKG